jgi:hypothetical protein
MAPGSLGLGTSFSLSPLCQWAMQRSNSGVFSRGLCRSGGVYRGAVEGSLNFQRGPSRGLCRSGGVRRGVFGVPEGVRLGAFAVPEGSTWDFVVPGALCAYPEGSVERLFKRSIMTNRWGHVAFITSLPALKYYGDSHAALHVALRSLSNADDERGA